MSIKERLKWLVGFLAPLAVAGGLGLALLELLNVPEPHTRVTPTPEYEPWIVAVAPTEPGGMLITAALIVAFAGLVVLTVSVVPPRVNANK